MHRRYETTISIQPAAFKIGYDSGDESIDDIDSIRSDYYESALEQVERNNDENLSLLILLRLLFLYTITIPIHHTFHRFQPNFRIIY